MLLPPSKTLRDRLSYWRQRFSIRMAFDWDENTRFFHASASERRRKNHIQELHDSDAIHVRNLGIFIVNLI